MKQMIVILFTVFTSGCLLVGEKTVRGSGNVTMEKRNAEEFNKIEVSGVFNIILKQADKNGIVVEADDNLQQYVLHRIENNTLYIKTKEKINFRKAKKMNVIISFVDIKV